MSLLPEALAVFSRGNKRLDHLGSIIITVELIQLRQPEVVTNQVAIRRVVRIAAQIAEVLHQHKRAVEFSTGQSCILGDPPQNSATRGCVGSVGRAAELGYRR